MYNTDVLVIGAGACGVAIARELSKYQLDIMVVDKRDDVGGDASKSNNGFISTEATVAPFTNESRIAVNSKIMMANLCRDLDVPLLNCGKITIAINDEEYAKLAGIQKQAFDNNVWDVEMRTAAEIREMEPNLNPDVKGGLWDPRTSHGDVFTLVIAQAENAAENGVNFLLDCEVIGMDVAKGVIETVHTTKGDIHAKWVINCAGLFCDKIEMMALGHCDFKINPRKGEFIVLDKATPVQVNHIIDYPGTANARGMGVAPTVEGNTIIFTTSVDIEDRYDKKATPEGFAALKAAAKRIVPNIHLEDTITQYVGLRPARTPADYYIYVSDEVKGYVSLSGIRSSGVTGSLGVAKYTLQMMREAGLELKRKEGYCFTRKGIVRFNHATPEEKDALIKANPLYGHIVCRCETITEAEIVEAIHRPVGARTLDAVKRRTRAGTGRCQSGFCGPQVMAILQRELGLKDEELRKRDGESFMLAQKDW